MKKRISILLMLLFIIVASLSGCGRGGKIVIKEPVLAEKLKELFERQTASFSKEELEGVYELTLEYSGKENIEELKYLKNIQLLDLSCGSTLDFSVLEELPSLEYLYITDATLTSVAELPPMANVKVLSLNNTKTVSLAGLESLPKLSELYITGSTVTDAFSRSEILNSLKVCEIELQEDTSNTNEISFMDAGVEDAVRQTISNVTQPVTQEQLNQVEALVLMDGEITSIEDLSNCNNLKSVMLWNTKVTDISPLLSLSSLTEVIIYTERKVDYSALYEKEQIKRICINGKWIKETK